MEGIRDDDGQGDARLDEPPASAAGDSILTTGVTVTRGLVGLFVLAASLALIEIGKSHYKMDRARTDQGQASYATERAAPVTRAGLVLASASTQR